MLRITYRVLGERRKLEVCIRCRIKGSVNLNVFRAKDFGLSVELGFQVKERDAEPRNTLNPEPSTANSIPKS